MPARAGADRFFRWIEDSRNGIRSAQPDKTARHSGYAPTYYPGTINASDAQPITVSADSTATANLTLVSAPGAGGYAGAAWFAALAAQGQAAFPQVAQRWVLDCADAPGHVLAALRAGVRAVVFTGAPELRERLAGVAAACGAALLEASPGAPPGPRA